MAENMEVFPLTVKIFSRSSRSGCIPTTISFYRELITNGCDAITKLKKLDADGRVSAAGRM